MFDKKGEDGEGKDFEKDLQANIDIGFFFKVGIEDLSNITYLRRN